MFDKGGINYISSNLEIDKGHEYANIHSPFKLVTSAFDTGQHQALI